MKNSIVIIVLAIAFSSPLHAQVSPSTCIQAVINAVAVLEDQSIYESEFLSKTCDGTGGGFVMEYQRQCLNGETPTATISAQVSRVGQSCSAAITFCDGSYSQVLPFSVSGAQFRQDKADLKAICNEIVEVAACP